MKKFTFESKLLSVTEFFRNSLYPSIRPSSPKASTGTQDERFRPHPLVVSDSEERRIVSNHGDDTLINANRITSLFALLILPLFLSGCGRHETTGGAFGTAAGAIIGSSVAGRNDKTTGAVLGGIIGNMIGGSAGRAADQDEAEENRHQHRIIRERERQIAAREAELLRTRNGLDRWCMSCYRQNNIAGAQRCPSCGDGLIREKYCNGCLTTFTATSSYRYCPYCRERRALVYR